ncbi:hypothetical protein CL617_04915 [archaeon]|nr:hypothetical protein [archaeon]|tara:strand:- start:2361 stop:2597 length:237 start_codon:yes stop_codon:yes gene_type:complete
MINELINIFTGFWFIFSLALFLLIFWIWQLVTMINSNIKKTEKGLWFIAFLVFGFITAFVWLIVKPKKRRKRRKRKCK